MMRATNPFKKNSTQGLKMRNITIIVLWFAATPLFAEQVHSTFDQLKISVQAICPVNGKPLTKSDAVKVKIGQEEIFLCCRECSKAKINKEHWVTIHRNFAAAQGICPVMEKALPPNPKSTIVNGQSIYICCPPCSKKIQANPKKHLTKLAGYYSTAIRNPSTATSSTSKGKAAAKIAEAMRKLPVTDQIQASVQQVCPVSGNLLGAMGTPQKVRVGKMAVFLCCEGCKQDKINKTHWSAIAQNLKQAQGKCPVMEKALPANAKSTIVDGRLVFICCPPCTKKITADPNKYLAKVTDYYRQFLSARVAQGSSGSKR